MLPDDVRVATRGNLLCVQGTPRDVRMQECLDCHRLEIDYSRFERLLELPGLSESAEIAVSYRDGMLLIRIQNRRHRGDEPQTSWRPAIGRNHRSLLPVLPLKNTVLFPYLFLPLSAGRPITLAAAEAAIAGEDKTFVAVAQRDAQADAPAAGDLYTVGTRAVIKKMARTPAGLELLVQGAEQVAALVAIEQTKPYLNARVRPAARSRTTRDRRSRPSRHGAVLDP